MSAPVAPASVAPQVAPADAFTQLVLHVLAHVPRAGPGDLHDPQHLAAAAPLWSPGARALLAEDAATLAALWRAAPALDRLDALPDLHASLAAFRRTAARPLAALGPGDVADPALLRALQALGPAGELVHALLGLLAPEFAEIHERALAPMLTRAAADLAPWLAVLAAAVPGLAAARVELAWSLGGRGRALPARILVGAGGDPRLPAVVAAHEHAVCTSGQVDHPRAEWSALVRLARWLRDAPPELRDAHARWLAGLRLAPLLADVVALGLVDAAAAAALDRDVRGRAARLAALRDAGA